MTAQSIVAMCAWLFASAMIPIPFLSGVFFCAFLFRARRFLSELADAAKQTLDEKKSAADTRRVVVIGNVGSGKSTAIRAAESSGTISNAAFLEEPVDEWRSLLEGASKSPASWLALQVSVACYYADPRSWIFFGSASSRPSVIVSERSLESVALFSHTSVAMAKMLETICVFKTVTLPDAVVFVTTPADVCFNRVAKGKRGQPGDKVIAERGVSYLQNLDSKHQKLCEWYKSHGVNVIRAADPIGASAAITDACIQVSEPNAADQRGFVSPEMMVELLSGIQGFKAESTQKPLNSAK